jgi:tRNA nucleotidyltransferase (CCA-adding enzyme)
VKVPAASELLARIGDLPAAAPLGERLAAAGGVYLVGGAVRDLLLGGASGDLDLVVEGDPAEVIALIGGDVQTYDRFGTATVTAGGYTYDIARARRERYPAPGALPEVEPAPLAEDLRRRDFTVNAAAIELASGELRSLPETLADLDARVLRVLHDRSFIDDPTRLLRLARYSGRLGFEIEPRTRALAADAIARGALRTVSGPRIGAELRLAARERDPVAVFGRLAELGVDLGFDGIEPELGRRAFELLPPDGDRAATALALAARTTDAATLTERLDALAFEAPERARIVSAATGAPSLAEELDRTTRPAEVAEAVGEAGPETVAVAGALGPEQIARDWIRTLRHVGLEIDGSDLLSAGVPEGPAIGRGLRAALAAKLDGRVDGRDAELAEALRGAR